MFLKLCCHYKLCTKVKILPVYFGVALYSLSIHTFPSFQDMRKGFEQESAATRKPTLLLTAAVPAGKSYIDGGYDIPSIMRYVFTGVYLFTGMEGGR